MTRVVTFALALSLTSAVSARAQDGSAPSQPPGPLVIERVHDGVLVAPEYKITELDGDTGQLAGARAGRLVDGVLFIGGAAYWLTNDSRDFKLAYGGVLIGWSTPAERRVSFGGKALIGGGSATLGTTLPGAVTSAFHDGRQGTVARFGAGSRGPTDLRRPQPGPPPVGTIHFIARDQFFVAEPQADLVTRLTGHTSITLSAGYRWTAMNEVLGDRLDGVTCSLGLQLGW
jgi:hypothetical protein